MPSGKAIVQMCLFIILNKLEQKLHRSHMGEGNPLPPLGAGVTEDTGHRGRESNKGDATVRTLRTRGAGSAGQF